MRNILIIIAVLIISAGLYLFLGYYNVAATKPHSKVVEMMLHSISERSIKRNSERVKNPYDVNDRDLYVKGFKEYDEMCVQCHGAPGIEPSPTGKGLNPKPPVFPDEELYEYTLEDIFWVTKHGVKMTGMPGYGRPR